VVDFAQMGTVIGARDAIAQAVAEGAETIAYKNRVIAEHRAALAVEEADAAGLKAQVELLLAELRRVNPNSPLFAPTGRKFASGRAETKIGKVYIDAFDKSLRAKGVANPEAHRERVG